jgi:hypothetical protein
MLLIYFCTCIVGEKTKIIKEKKNKSEKERDGERERERERFRERGPRTSPESFEPAGV